MANLLYNLAQPFSDTKQYTQGVIVIYNDRMYEMTADEYTPGPFDPEKFTERFLSEMISGKLNSNLGAKLLWTNSNVSAGWAQDASISVNISKYKYIVLELLTTSTGTPFYIFADTKNWYGNVCAATVISNVTYQRWIVRLTTNTITLGSGAPNNMYAIPYKVYGFNGTLE